MRGAAIAMSLAVLFEAASAIVTAALACYRGAALAAGTFRECAAASAAVALMKCGLKLCLEEISRLTTREIRKSS